MRRPPDALMFRWVGDRVWFVWPLRAAGRAVPRRGLRADAGAEGGPARSRVPAGVPVREVMVVGRARNRTRIVRIKSPALYLIELTTRGVWAKGLRLYRVIGVSWQMAGFPTRLRSAHFLRYEAICRWCPNAPNGAFTYPDALHLVAPTGPFGSAARCVGPSESTATRAASATEILA